MTRAKIIAACFGIFMMENLASITMAHSGLHMNYSASVPLGLYRESPHGEYAGICLSLPQIKQALAVGVETMHGNCPGGVVPILKPLIQAGVDNPITFSASGFSVKGKLMPNTAPKLMSRTGVRLAHYPFGTYYSGIWAISDYAADSYDSRYIGPIEKNQIQFRAVPVLTK